MNDVENLITLGKVGSVYGIKGWLKIHSFTENPADIFDYSPWSLKLGGKLQSVTVTDCIRWKITISDCYRLA